MVTRNLPVPSENRGGSCNEWNAVHEIYCEIPFPAGVASSAGTTPLLEMIDPGKNPGEPAPQKTRQLKC